MTTARGRARHGGYRVTCASGVHAAEVERWIAEGALVLPDSGRAGPFRVGARDVLVKARREALAKRLARGFARRPSRARTAFEIGVRLAAAGVRAARPLALVEEGRRRAWIVVERVEGMTLREFILDHARREGGLEEGLKRRILGAVAVETARLHAAGVRQRDLKAPNVIVASHGGGIRATLIDLEGMSLLRRPPGIVTRSRDLARLWVSLREKDVAAAGMSRGDWRFFVGAYLEAASGRAPAERDIDRLVARTERRARAKESRNRRRGRITW